MTTVQIELRPEGLPQVGDMVAGRYLLLGELGRGGMGVVFEGRHVELEQPVAVKFAVADGAGASKALERFVREARACAAIRHANVIRVHDFGRYGASSAYLVMERLVGESLGRRIVRDGPLSFALTIRVMLQVLEGLHAGHQVGVVHRDVKPDNIFLEGPSDAPVVRLLDFGIAYMSSREGYPALTNDGALLGTPCYMSPEQATGARTGDCATDIFNVGATLYHALTGRAPYASETLLGALTAAAKGEFAPPLRLRPDLPSALERIVVCAMAFAPSDRFATAQELAEALRAFEATASASAPDERRSDASVGSLAGTSIARRSPRLPRTSGTRAMAASLLLPFIAVGAAQVPHAPRHEGAHEEMLPLAPMPLRPALPAPAPFAMQSAHVASLRVEPAVPVAPVAPVPRARPLTVEVVTEDEAVVSTPNRLATVTARESLRGDLARVTLRVPSGTRRVCCAIPYDHRRPCAPITFDQEGIGHASCFAD